MKELSFGKRRIVLDGKGGVRSGLAEFFANLTGRKYFVLLVVGIIAAFSIYGASKIIIDNVMIEYFKNDTDIFKSDKFIREKFGGSKIVSVVVEADSTEMLLHPDSLGAVDDLGRYLERQVGEVGKVMGFTDLVKRINQVFNTGESPEGLTAAAAPADSGEFGFGSFDDFDAGSEVFDSDQFGFGDFGFGTFDDTDTAAADGAVVEAGSVFGSRVYTLDEIAALLDKAASSGADRSITGDKLVGEFKRLVNFEGAAYYEIPRDPARYGKQSPEELSRLVSNYLVLLAGNIDDYANDPLEPTSIKTTVQMRTTGQADTDRGVAEINNFVKANFPAGVRVIVGGSAMVEGSTNTLVVQSQLTSVIFSIIAMFIIMTISYRSAAAGVISTIPLSILILINFAAMGFLGIKLNLATAMISSISIGVGIDYTIHFIEAYKREYRLSEGKGDFIKRAYYVSGAAIIVDALSVGLGFAVLLLSHFNMLMEFGLLVALAMIISALSGLIIVPALLSIFKPKFIEE
jgi:predicted RND superfamily exporter protein